MRKTISLSIMTALIISTFSGCVSKYTPVNKKESVKDNYELYQDNNNVQSQSSIQEVFISGSFFEEEENIPAGPNIEQLQLDGVKLRDFVRTVSLLTGVNISIQNSQDPTKIDQTTTTSTSSIADKDFMSEKKIFLAVRNVSVLDALKVAVGSELGITYENGTYILGKKVTTTVNIPSVDMVVKDSAFGSTDTTAIKTNANTTTIEEKNTLVDSLKSMGATNIVFNKVANKLTFTSSADKNKVIRKFLEDYISNLVLIDFEVAIYEVILNKSDQTGINWTKLGRYVDPATGGTLGISGSASAITGNSFSLTGNYENGKLGAAGVLSFLKTNYNLSTISKPTVKLLNGSKAELNIGLQEEFAKEIGKVSTSNSNSATTTTTTFEKVLSGVGLAIQGSYFNSTVVGSLNGTVSSIPSYDKLIIDGNTYTKPKINTKAFSSNFRLKPGDTIVISGLMEKKNSKKIEGIPGIMDTPAIESLGGYVDGEVINTEVVIMLTPKVTKFVYEKDITKSVKKIVVEPVIEKKEIVKIDYKPAEKEVKVIKPAEKEVKVIKHSEPKEEKNIAKETPKKVEEKKASAEEIAISKKGKCVVIVEKTNVRECADMNCEIATVATKGSSFNCKEDRNGWTELGNNHFIKSEFIVRK